MSQREAQRLAVLGEVVAGRMKVGQAAASLGVSERQVKRLTRRLREEGSAGLISKRRGAPSNRRIVPEVRERYMGLVREHYSDFGPTLACEYLQRDHGFTYSVETLRGWMSEEQLWKPKQRRRVRLHSPRPRRGCRGELVQIDGSHHDWFEGRAAKCCLIAFIDDATGQVLAARFFGGETTQAYLALLREHAGRHGLPAAYYSDRAGIFTKHDERDGKPTQFARVLLQLDIESICANTPQAKGRVERCFRPCRTAWSRRCACKASAASSRPMSGWGTTCRSTTRALPYLRPAAPMRTGPGSARLKHSRASVRCTTSVT